MADVEEVAVLPLQTDQEEEKEEKAGGNQKVEENKSKGEENKDGIETMMIRVNLSILRWSVRNLYLAAC